MTPNKNLFRVMDTRNHSKNVTNPRIIKFRWIYLTILTVFVLCTTQSIFAQTSFKYGFNYNFKEVLIDGRKTKCAIVRAVSEYLPAQQAGLRQGDVIVAIDGQQVSEEMFSNIGSKSKINFNIKRFGNQNVTLDIFGLPCSSSFANIAESDYAALDIIGRIDYYGTVKTLGIEPINIMSDPDIDFFQYTSFDFEFTGQNIMQQREIAPLLETFLTRRGLKRDKDNPDILVFIDFFSDRREQYVPPTQELSTRYGTTYNVWTKQWETRQYVQSHESGNYTKVDYLSKLAISMADAKKMSKGDMEKAKIWEANYEVIYREKADHKKFADYIGWEMLMAFPFKIERLRIINHWFTGIIYDGAIAGKVTGVIPNSPAEKAGIKAGNIIKSSSWGTNTIFKNTYKKLIETSSKNPIESDTRHLNYGDFALYRASNMMYGNYSYESPFMSTYISNYKKRKNLSQFDEISHGSKPLIFTIKSVDGKTKKVEVNPIKVQRREIFYEL